MPVTLFAADDGVNGVELWRSNGTPGGTVLVKNIAAGGTASGPGNTAFGIGTPMPFAVLGNYAYFSAYDGTRTQLWRSDGTEAGTTMITSYASDGGAAPSNIVSVNGVILFVGNGASGFGIYKYDGSSVSYVTNIFAGATNMAVIGNRLYWGGESGLSDSGWYQTDGTSVTKISNNRNITGIMDVGNGTGYLLGSGVGGASVSFVNGTTVTAVTNTSGGGAPPMGAVAATSVNGFLIFTPAARFTTRMAPPLP